VPLRAESLRRSYGNETPRTLGPSGLRRASRTYFACRWDGKVCALWDEWGDQRSDYRL